MSAGAGPRFEVRVVDEVLAEDLARCTRAARAAIEPVVAEVRRDGVPFEWLRRCEEEGHDGTRLGGCVKFYIPRPAGQWGAAAASRSGFGVWVPGGAEREVGPLLSPAIKRAISVLAFLERAAIRHHELVDGAACRVHAVALRRTNFEPAAGGYFNLKDKHHRN